MTSKAPCASSLGPSKTLARSVCRCSPTPTVARWTTRGSKCSGNVWKNSSGRVDLTRAGNTVTAATRGVAAFTLLVSPDQFDFAKPVKVVVNGRTVFNGKVQKSLATLLKYAAADNDRTMLFGAEIHVELSR